jgi:hypothetical protein
MIIVKSGELCPIFDTADRFKCVRLGPSYGLAHHPAGAEGERCDLLRGLTVAAVAAVAVRADRDVEPGEAHAVADDLHVDGGVQADTWVALS